MYFLDRLSRPPGLLHLRRIRCDADNVGPIFLDKFRNWLLFNVGVKDHNFVTAFFAKSR